MAIFFNSSNGSCEVFYVDVTNSSIEYEDEFSSKPCSISIFKKEKIEDTEVEEWVLVEERVIILNNFVVGDIKQDTQFTESKRDQYNNYIFRAMFFAGGEKIEISIEGEFAVFYTDDIEEKSLNGEVVWAESTSTFYIPHAELYNYKIEVYDSNYNKLEIVDYNNGPQLVNVSSLETKAIWGMENVLVNRVSFSDTFARFLVSSSLKNKEVSTEYFRYSTGYIITLSQLVRPNFENIFMDNNNPTELYEKTYACQF